jgi:hypothetical protein
MNAQWLTRRNVARAALALMALVILIQFIPYGRDHANPPRREEPNWDRPATRDTFMRVCKNCHSNETDWPSYSNIAPLSWLVQYDVDEGRSEFNVSEWGRAENKGDEAAEEVREGEMPPWYYLPTHPEARMTKAEKEAFIRGLALTFGEKGEKKKDSGK